MKKSLIILAVLSVCVGTLNAQSSVNIVDIVDTGITFSNNVAKDGNTGSKFSMNSGVIQGSRIGFKGTGDLGGGLSTVFQMENEF